MRENKRISFTTTLDGKLLQKIKVYCVKNEMNVNDLLEKLLERFLTQIFENKK